MRPHERVCLRPRQRAFRARALTHPIRMWGGRSARATLAGTRTFGKAVIQTVEELDDGSAVVVTIAQYQTPKRTNINLKGIEVDRERECPPGNVGAAAVACVADDVKRLLADAK